MSYIIHNKTNRRGVILLLVLALMTMFALLVVTFMVVTSQSWRMASSSRRTEQTIDYRTAYIGAMDSNQAIMELLRGSDRSVIRHHNMIEAVYGQPTFGIWNSSTQRYDRVDSLRGRIVGNVSYIGNMAPEDRLRFAPEDAIDTQTGATNLTTQLLLFEIALPNYAGASNFDLMGNVLFIVENRTQGQFTTNETANAYKFYTKLFDRVKGIPVRVVKKTINPNNGNVIVCVLPFVPYLAKGNNGQDGIPVNIDDPAGVDLSLMTGRDFIVHINGAPYSGTGAGFRMGLNPWQKQLSATDMDCNELSSSAPTIDYRLPLAMRPNSFAPNIYDGQQTGNSSYVGYDGYMNSDYMVQMNVDYTAPDVNNMYLAWYDLDPTLASPLKQITPSFHRPTLVQELMQTQRLWNRPGPTPLPLTAQQKQDLLRKVVLRPLPFDHPNFTGSTPAWQNLNVSESDWQNDAGPLTQELAALAAGWIYDDTAQNQYKVRLDTAGNPERQRDYLDVDNDGDGVKDGIWIDFGSPVRMDQFGRKYKALLSTLVLDMDGRLNLNVHGNKSQIDVLNDDEFGTAFPYYTGTAIDVHPLIPATQQIVKRGLGTGPASVRSAYAFRNMAPNTPPWSTTNFNNFFGRFLVGFGNLPGRYTAWETYPSTNDRPGRSGAYEWFAKDGAMDYYWNSLYFRDIPADGNSLLNNSVSYGGTPPDLWDMSVLAFDFAGQKTFLPQQWTTSSSWNKIQQDNPYEFDPYHESVYDTPFTPAEFEDLLRVTDIDHATLPKRLQQLLMSDPSDPASDRTLIEKARNFVTTESNDISSPNRRMNGQFGIYSLVYKCVEDQYIRACNKGGTAANMRIVDNQTGQASDVTLGDYISQKPLVRSRQTLSKDLEPTISQIALKIVNQLPEEIRNGQRLDLNKLAKKMSWVDHSTPQAHIQGLKGRADLARGIYLLLMVLSYEQLYGIDDAVSNAQGTALVMSSAQNNPNLFPRFAPAYIEPALQQEERLQGTGEKAAELRRQVMATRLAQYAINIIEFIDPDATSTPMVFDIDPFAIVLDDTFNPPIDYSLSGWLDFYSTKYWQNMNNAPGLPNGELLLGFDSLMNNPGLTTTHINDILTTRVYGDVRGTNMARARLIWGMERPELALTETIATHDRGTADTRFDDGKRQPQGPDTEKDDKDWDQVRIPEASAWFEVYCTSNPNQPHHPEDAFSYNNIVGWYIDLSRTTGNANYALNSGTDPLYRIAISESTDPMNQKNQHPNSHANRLNNFASRLVDAKQNPITFSLQTRQTTTGYVGSVQELTRYSSILGPSDNGAGDDVKLDRLVWFRNVDPFNIDGNNTEHQEKNRTFWMRGSRTGAHTTMHSYELLPGEYMIVAPRMTTFLGSREGTTRGIPTGEGITLNMRVPDPNGSDQDNPLYYGANPPKVLIAAMRAPTNWTTTNLPVTAYLGLGIDDTTQRRELGIGINISAPLPTGSRYYPEPMVANKAVGEHTYVDGYYLNSMNVNLANLYGDALTGPFRDRPLDRPYEDADGTKDNDMEGHPLAEDQMIGNGTVPMVRTAVLQRVADPYRPFDPVLNPYITIDWNMMDLTVFTGEDANEDKTIGYDQIKPNGNSISANDNYIGVDDYTETRDKKIRLSSRQWGMTGSQLHPTIPNPWSRNLDPRTAPAVDENNTDLTGQEFVNINQLSASRIKGTFFVQLDKPNSGNPYYWNRVGGVQIPGEGSTLPDIDDADRQMVLPHRPQHTLGKLNWMYVGVGATAAGTLNSGIGIPNVVVPNGSVDFPIGNTYRGTPSNGNGLPIPFINLAWNDSPLANPYEVMQVPASSPGRFGLEFVDSNTEKYEIYNMESTTIDRTNPNNVLMYNTAGGKNFIVGSLGSGGRFGYPLVSQNVGGSQDYSGLGHQLNFFHYSLNMAYKSGSIPNIVYPAARNLSMNLGSFLEHVEVPSKFIGTKLWLDPKGGLVGGNYIDPCGVSLFREPGRININTMSFPVFDAMMNDRTVWKGSNAVGSYNYLDMSRRIGDPSFADTPAFQTRVVEPHMQYPFRSTSSGNLVIDTSMVHGSQSVISRGADLSLLRGVFEDNSGGATASFSKLLTPANNVRNTTEELDAVQRLSNIATNRSNVFAVWVTIGYFEVEEINTAESKKLQAIYPDGHRLGKELGYDTGDTTRHRSFYLIDRSIPVGFRRGEDVNVKDTIILQRTIE